MNKDNKQQNIFNKVYKNLNEDKNLNLIDRCVLSSIIDLSKLKDRCIISNIGLAESWGVSETTIKDCIKKLKKLNYIYSVIFYSKNTKRREICLGEIQPYKQSKKKDNRRMRIPILRSLKSEDIKYFRKLQNININKKLADEFLNKFCKIKQYNKSYIYAKVLYLHQVKHRAKSPQVIDRLKKQIAEEWQLFLSFNPKIIL